MTHRVVVHLSCSKRNLHTGSYSDECRTKKDFSVCLEHGTALLCYSEVL